MANHGDVVQPVKEGHSILQECKLSITTSRRVECKLGDDKLCHCIRQSKCRIQIMATCLVVGETVMCVLDVLFELRDVLTIPVEVDIVKVASPSTG